MRIGILCHASMGGSSRIAVELASTLALRGHEVHLFARTAPFFPCRFSRNLTLHTVRVANGDHHPADLLLDWPSDELESYVKMILKVIEEEALAILHFHYGFPFAFVAAEVRRRRGGAWPVIIGTLHGTDVTCCGDVVKRAQMMRWLNYVDELTTVSRSHAQLATELLHLSAAPRVIPNFIDLTEFQALSPEVQRSRPRIVHISNFRPVKNVPRLAQLYHEIREHVDAELWLIGDGPEMAALRAALHAFGLERDVTYWGIQRNVAAILQQADLLLLTSAYESFSMVALEAMACGVPVLAPRVGGIPEVVADGETGSLYPANEPSIAVELAIRLLTDPQLLMQLKKKARAHAGTFDKEKTVLEYENLYQQWIERRMQKAHEPGDLREVRV
ncbi:MAG: N-acetyl-alpha-D-glucosaminyl L-malate synthase BshA [Methanomicrobia archaeon]|nr:N-acetyl-alpha-D-glucosaminyl L-malate synthase BshA [Methanomicrobia archaeon]